MDSISGIDDFNPEREVVALMQHPTENHGADLQVVPHSLHINLLPLVMKNRVS